MRETEIEPAPGAQVPRYTPPLPASSAIGLIGAGAVAATAAWLVSEGVVHPPFEHPMFALLFAIVFGGVSLVEVPLMVFAMCRLLAESSVNRRTVAGLNAVYVLFAAVYALPVFFFTGNLVWGWIVAALAVVRFATSLIFVRAR